MAVDSGKSEWTLNTGDNAWQMTAATIVGMQSVPGLVILYGSIVKKKWAVNSAFMALYAFAAVLVVWALCGFTLSFSDEEMIPGFWGKPSIQALQYEFLFEKSYTSLFPKATMSFFQVVFAAITLILLAGSLLGRMNFHAWMLFVPLWLIFSYTIGAYALWNLNGYFFKKIPTIDCSGGYVIHLSSGIAGFTAAYWVGPRMTRDRERFPPNNVLLMVGGGGLLWLGWSGFNGGGPGAANELAALAVMNTHVCAATSLIVWMALDRLFFGRPSLIGALQGMITGLVCITPAACVVQGWAAMVMGVAAGSIPWCTMMVLQKRVWFLQRVDDTMGVFHTHAVAGLLGGILSGLFAHPRLCQIFYNNIEGEPPRTGFVYTFSDPGTHRKQMGYQLFAALFIIVLNVAVTSLICVVIGLIVPLRMSEEALEVGDDAAHGEEAYALWGDGEKVNIFRMSATVEQSKTFHLDSLSDSSY
ncbi:hypothetical protein SUGI_0618630 [Cryptomeria japonica]|uniref:ammonium transporter 2 member 5-like isoform X2 n=1 Tax=Cryptomeria japonica TaxID=3369 RepID=UPI002414C4CD|nr:ammonium transporter 2 member 5-like isoform X2 [Cryptomeria japonica]GLJ30982.1 hypothetical protein SUGI_0618630 [Cryptomeria japonica]